jgi:starch synthase (maltosyl-transferring)
MAHPPRKTNPETRETGPESRVDGPGSRVKKDPTKHKPDVPTRDPGPSTRDPAPYADAGRAPARSRVLIDDGRRRVVIEGVRPEIDAGRFPAKRAIGERVVVEADIFADGHDTIRAVLFYRHQSERSWNQVPMKPLANDRWQAPFSVERLGQYEYTMEGWVDHILTWYRDLKIRIEAGQELGVHLLVGAKLIEEAAERAAGEDRALLQQYVKTLRSDRSESKIIAAITSPEFEAVALRYPDRTFATRYHRVLNVTVDPVRARFSSWYEMFPRSTSPQSGRHGTFADVIQRLPYIEELGFNVLYLPPIHPIGRSFRKGKNNKPHSEASDMGSPWAIGAKEGGHKDVHPHLGTLDDFRRLLKKARARNIEIAMDMAFQTSPDHPLVKKHPEFFQRRPDGTVQYAENPPKKYEDIYPFFFETEEWQQLWEELRGVFLFWIEQGVRIFRVDNPHTKPFPFWDWVIREIKTDYPDAIFLAEAFTRPKVMYYLAKLGFSQSYTYFAWRNEKWELMQYFTELTKSPVREFFRPNAWPNTPDILTEYLQHGGRPAFMIRFVLAATLCANYGIYGPAFELLEHVPREPGSEEYRDSEKYELRTWDLKRADSLRLFIARINRIRNEHPALQNDWSLQFHNIDNGQMLCYSKSSDEGDTLLTVVSLDPYHPQSGWVELNLNALRLPSGQSFQVHDLVTDARYSWHGPRNFVSVNPQVVPAHIFLLRQRVRSERNFEYYL